MIIKIGWGCVFAAVIVPNLILVSVGTVILLASAIYNFENENKS